MPPVKIDAQPMQIDAQAIDASPVSQSPTESPNSPWQAFAGDSPNSTKSLLGFGESPDIVGRFKQMLTAEPPAFARSTSPLFKPMDDAMRGVADVMLPGSIPEAALQAGIGWGADKLAPVAVEAGLRAFRAVRPLAKEVAVEGIGNLLPEEALKARDFYKAAQASDKMIPIKTMLSARPGEVALVEATTPHSFSEAQRTIQNLRIAANKLEREGKTAEASVARQHVKDIEGQVESVFPGFQQAQKGYAKLKDIGLVQEMVNEKGPLAALETDIAKGRVEGPAGTLLKGGGRATRWLGPDELKEVKGILEKLGPEPGNSIVRQMVEGRAIGGTVGGALGYQHGGIRGAAEGAAAGIMVPATINWLIRQSLTHPATRAILKQGLERKGGLANPITWQILGQLGTRLGLDMVSPEQRQAEQQTQARQQGMQMMQQIQQAVQAQGDKGAQQ